MVTITLYTKQKKRHRCTEQTLGLSRIRTLYGMAIPNILRGVTELTPGIQVYPEWTHSPFFFSSDFHI